MIALQLTIGTFALAFLAYSINKKMSGLIQKHEDYKS